MKINDGHYLELLDRLHISTCNLEDHLLNHPLTRKEKDIEKLIKFCVLNLSRAYQIVGAKMFENEKRKKIRNKIVSRRRKKSKN